MIRRAAEGQSAARVCAEKPTRSGQGHLLETADAFMNPIADWAMCATSSPSALVGSAIAAKLGHAR
eukprot:416168-Alexandrium_andersonii.AAC.1